MYAQTMHQNRAFQQLAVSAWQQATFLRVMAAVHESRNRRAAVSIWQTGCGAQTGHSRHADCSEQHCFLNNAPSIDFLSCWLFVPGNKHRLYVMIAIYGSLNSRAAVSIRLQVAVGNGASSTKVHGSNISAVRYVSLTMSTPTQW